MKSHDAPIEKLQSDVAELRIDVSELKVELRTGLLDVRTRMDAMNDDINARFEASQRRDDRLSALTESVHSDVKLTLEHLTRGLTSIGQHHRRLDAHDGRLDDLDMRLTAMEAWRRKPS